MSTKYVQAKPAYLKFAIDESATAVTLTEFLDLSGNPVIQADIGTTGYATIEPNTTREEAVSFTITSSVVDEEEGTSEAVLVLTRGLLGKQPYGTGGTAHKHQAGSKFIISNNPDLLNKFTAKDNDETITGTWTFNVAPVALSVTRANETVLGNVKLTEEPALELGTTTITIASPAVITKTSHGLIAGDSVRFTTTGTLPTGLVVGTEYFVIATGLATDSFQVSATAGGTAINTSGTQSGIHTLIRTTPFAVGVNNSRLPTANEKEAMAGGGDFGTPSTSNKFVTEDGVDAAILATTNPTVQVFTSSGTWTKPAGLKYAVIAVQAGGGGGSNSGNNGGTGGTTSFGSHLSASGGGGGNGSALGSSPNGSVGVGSNGDINLQGGWSTGGHFGFTGSNTYYYAPQTGGRSFLAPYGNGGQGAFVSGTSGRVHQSGAAGGYSEKIIAASSLASTETVTIGTGGTNPGGTGGPSSGADGVVIVTEYYS